ncbi:MAG: hypothetical protein ACREP8_08115 [Candidatus Binatia bacterium]
MQKFIVVTGNFFLTAILLFPLAAQACAVCLTGSVANDPLTDAFNWSVLFLMAMPYTVLASIGMWLFYSHWRAGQGQGELRKKLSTLRVAWTYSDNKESGR